VAYPISIRALTEAAEVSFLSIRRDDAAQAPVRQTTSVPA
jgi:hypothetical protein